MNLKKPSQADFKKPYKDFPLSYHPPSKRLYKKINNKRHYFGQAKDWQQGVEEYNRVRDDLFAGRSPQAKKIEGLSLGDGAELFLESKEHQYENGEISLRTLNDHIVESQRVCDCLGKQAVVESLQPADLAKLRKHLAKNVGPTTLGNRISRAKTLFNYLWDMELIKTPVRFKTSFKKPTKKTRRLHRASLGSMMIEADAIRDCLEHENTSSQLRAMILLGVQSGMGNSDVARLEISHLDLEKGWIEYARNKTGVRRKIPLWPETVEALRVVLDERGVPANDDLSEFVFITKYGLSWYKEASTGPVGQAFTKILKATDHHKAGLGFYGLRRTFETVADECKDKSAVDSIMGHEADDMATVYRQRVNDARLISVTDYVRQWLFI
ncbi:MAG: tyrosine-type recombinase/integrase [Pirellulales bacterium]|jgi:integrase